MTYREKFNGVLEVDWIDVNDAMPLDAHLEEFPHEPGHGGVLTDVFALIDNEEDCNEDPSIVLIGFLLDHDMTEKWCWCGGGDYPECHVKNIKFWAEVPEYDKRSMPL
jgi:hypothetical protein